MTTRAVEPGRFRTGDRHELAPRAGGARGRFIAWVVVRLTGLLLTILVLGHFALTHIITDVADTGATFVAGRWGSAFWLAWDWLMLASAVVHGAAGVWIVIDDYTTDGPRRRRLRRLLIVISVLGWGIGTVTISTVILG